MTRKQVSVESSAEAKTEAEPQPEGFDRVFPLIGGHHRYQWLLLAVTSLGGIQALHLMGYQFLGAIPDHWCKIDELTSVGMGVNVNWTQAQIKNLSIPRYTAVVGGSTKEKYEQCFYFDLNYDELLKKKSFDEAYSSALVEVAANNSTKKPCTSWVYDTSVYSSTTVTTFNLVCGRRHLAATIQATFMSGYFLGSLLGALSDQILGRRGCILLAVTLIIFGGFGASFATSYTSFILFRFIIAVGAAGSFQNRFTLLLEYCDIRSRAAFGFLQQCPFCIFYSLMAVYAYFLRDWRDLQLAFSVSMLVLISYIWILPESSRWLATKNRDEEAAKILEGIAKTNRRPPPPRDELVSILESCNDKTAAEEVNENESNVSRALKGLKLILHNYLNLVRTPELRRRSLIIWWLYMSVVFVYYGISFGALTLSDNPFIIVFIGAMVEIPANLIAIPLASKWGRRPTVASTFILSGLACIVISVVPSELDWLRVSLSMAGKLAISTTFPVVMLLGTELYPTSERATGFGAAALMGRFGSIAAPFVAIVESVYTDLPLVICAVVSIAAGLVALLVPETKDMELREYVDEVETIAARRTSLSLSTSAKQESSTKSSTSTS